MKPIKFLSTSSQMKFNYLQTKWHTIVKGRFFFYSTFYLWWLPKLTGIILVKLFHFFFIKRTSHKIMLHKLVANHITNVTHNQIPHKRSTPDYKCLNFTWWSHVLLQKDQTCFLHVPKDLNYFAIGHWEDKYNTISSSANIQHIIYLTSFRFWKTSFCSF